VQQIRWSATVRKWLGTPPGKKKLGTEGKVEQVKGTVHIAAGGAKEAGEEAIDAVKNAPSKH
jgi:uncharacterized protein YjbJ (UPF0337 family)